MDYKCRIADLNILVKEYYDRWNHRIIDFESEFDLPDIVIPVLKEDVYAESILDNSQRRIETYQNAAVFRKFAEQLPFFDGVVFHSCFINACGKGIAFTAPSGTGKTTHMLLWQKLLGENFQIINGDKPILRFIDNQLFGYGTPWSGKEHYYTIGRTLLTDICLISRSKKNYVEALSRKESEELLIRQIYSPKDTISFIKTIELINKILDNCNFWRINCNMDIEAAQIAYDAIFNNI